MLDSVLYPAEILLRLDSEDRYNYFYTVSHTYYLIDFPEDDPLSPLKRGVRPFEVLVLMADEGVSLDS